MTKSKETTCFAYDEGKCKILSIAKCEGESCRFLKTKKEVQESEKRALERIKSLDKEDQKNILNLYYPKNKKILKKI